MMSKKAEELRIKTADLSVKIVSGMDGLLEVATEAESEILVTAIVGMLGIRPTIAAIKARQKDRTCQQRDTGYGRSSDHSTCKRISGADPSGGQ